MAWNLYGGETGAVSSPPMPSIGAAMCLPTASLSRVVGKVSISSRWLAERGLEDSLVSLYDSGILYRLLMGAARSHQVRQFERVMYFLKFSV